ncbi:MAG: Uma2 family endonuclease [Gemmatimonadaceae bacterium]|nr:Uma2 family endonuclease [Gemmatimonadaceae bacterium]
MSIPACSTLPDRSRLWTAEELLHKPDDGMRHELVRGELRTMPLASGPHGAVIMRFAWMLLCHVIDHDLGVLFSPDTGVHLFSDPDTVRAPDISFVSKQRVPPEGIGRGFLRTAPDLAVEVLSPEDTAAGIEEKIADYFGAGTRLVWVVDPKARTVAVYRPGAHAYVLAAHERLEGEEVLPSFSCRVGEIFVWLDARGV